MNENTEADSLQSSYEGQLSILNQSLGFLLLVIFSVLLSFYALTLQRKQLIYSQECPERLESLPPVFPIRLLAGAIVSGSLCFFLHLALQSAQQPGQTPEQCLSSRRNIVASFLVLAAALIRLFDLSEIQRLSSCSQAEKGEEQAKSERAGACTP
ncbi:MAG: hypothetical protein HFG27_00950 [Provencibacterium sp.]|nr:hypothetical protein [Provencibacterium sp.]